MTHFEKEDLDELIKLLDKISQSAAFLADDDKRREKLEAVRQGLQSFHTTAAMLGMEAIEQSGLALMDFFTTKIVATEAIDPSLIFPFVSTIKAIVGEMRGVANGNGAVDFEVGSILEILNEIPGSMSPDEVAGELTADDFPADIAPCDFDAGEKAGDELREISVDEGVDEHGCQVTADCLSDLKRITESLGENS